MSNLDFVQLAESEEWKALWESDEIRKVKEYLTNQLAGENTPPDRARYLAGRLSMLDYIPRYVRACARGQLLEREKADKELAERKKQERGVTTIDRIRQRIPKVS